MLWCWFMKSQECFLLFLLHETDGGVLAVQDTNVKHISIWDGILLGCMSEIESIFTNSYFQQDNLGGNSEENYRESVQGSKCTANARKLRLFLFRWYFLISRCHKLRCFDNRINHKTSGANSPKLISPHIIPNKKHIIKFPFSRHNLQHSNITHKLISSQIYNTRTYNTINFNHVMIDDSNLGVVDTWFIDMKWTDYCTLGVFVADCVEVVGFCWVGLL